MHSSGFLQELSTELGQRVTTATWYGALPQQVNTNVLDMYTGKSYFCYYCYSPPLGWHNPFAQLFPQKPTSFTCEKWEKVWGDNAQLLSTVVPFSFSFLFLSLLATLESPHMLSPCLREEEDEATAAMFCSAAAGEGACRLEELQEEESQE